MSRVDPGYTRIGGYYNRFKDGETKFLDGATGSAGLIPAAGVSIASVNLIAQGVGENQRVGRKCTLKSIDINYNITLAEGDALATPKDGDICRIIFFLDKQTNGANAAVTDVLDTASYLSHYNLSNSGRFVILEDKSTAVNFMGMASDGAGVVSQGIFIKTKKFHKNCNIPLEFSDTSGVISELRSNNIGTIAISKNAFVSYTGIARVRFSDN